MGKYVPVWDPTFSLFGYIPRRGIAGSYGNSVFNFLRKCHIVIVHWRLYHFTFSPTTHKSFNFSAPHQHLLFSTCFFVFFIIAILICVKCYFAVFFLKKLFIYLFLWLCWVFVSVRGLSIVAASGGHSSSRCAGLSLSRPLLLRGTGSRRAGSAIVTHGPSRSTVCGVFPDQGSNPCPLHWQADSQPLRHQGSPILQFWFVFSQWLTILSIFSCAYCHLYIFGEMSVF